MQAIKLINPSSLLDARSAIQHRVFVGSGASLPSVNALVAPQVGGLKMVGKSAAKHARQLSQLGTDFPIVLDVEASVEYEATPQQPFLLAQDTLFPETLETRLEGLRGAGSAIALTPTGHIPAGSEALETAIRRANAIDRDDVVLSLPLAHDWLSTEVGFERLCRQLDQCEHVVAISLAHEQDPLDEDRVGERLRRLAALDKSPFLDRADLVGLDYVAHGGLGACIGISTRLRHGQSPSIKGRPFNSKDGRTSVYWPGMLRMVRPKFLDELYPMGADAPRCSCPFCDGATLTSFTQKKVSQQRARNHNAWWIQRLTEQVLTNVNSLSVWRATVAGAIEHHEQLRVELRRPNLTIPRSFELWAW